MIDTLTILRNAGFFQQYSSLTNDEILDIIYQQRKESYSEMFGYDYDPGRDLSDHKLILQDDSKVFHLDLECDVCKENTVYTWILKDLEILSGGKVLITDIIENWETETGPIKVSCKLNGAKKLYTPGYHDDWVDQTFIDNVLADISIITNDSFHICLGPDDEWLAQDVNYMRLNREERKILEQQLNWTFFDDFLKRMRK